MVDQTRRNRLLHFKHTAKGTMLRFVDEEPDLVLGHLQNEGKFRLKALPDPEDEPADERTAQFRAELSKARLTDEVYRVAIAALDPEDPSAIAKEEKIERDLRDHLRSKLGLPPRPTRRSLDLNAHAAQHGVVPAYDLAIPKIEPKHKDEWLQTLLFQDQLKTRVAGLARKAREVEQETGVTTLHLAFGFLEWFESDASDSAFSSPLLLLPIGLEKVTGKRGEEEYQLTALDDAPTTNLSLELRLKRDFGITLPEFKENRQPIETYLRDVADTTKTLKRCKIRRYLTLAPFSFARIAMYRDLDPSNWRDLPGGGAPAHPLVMPLLRGGAEQPAGDGFAVEYQIDEPAIEKIAPILVSDADSSQHSAIVDAMKGQNLVVEGPPGTGKSQTIANLIANALYKGQRVLFVSEKMAALDVVKSRLNKAGLGHFCLPLHAAGAKPAAVIEALKERADLRAPRLPASVVAARSEIARARDALRSHLEALHAEAGPLGETVHAYIGRLTDLTRLLPSLPALLRSRASGLPSSIEHNDSSEARDHLETLETAARAASSLGINVAASPFRVLGRADLFPDECAALLSGLEELVEACQHQEVVATELGQWLGKTEAATSLEAILQLTTEVDGLADPPPDADRTYIGTLTSSENIEDAFWMAAQVEALDRTAATLRRASVEDPASLRINAVRAAIDFAAPLGVAGLTINQILRYSEELIGLEASWIKPSETLAGLSALLRLPSDPEVSQIRLACKAAELATRVDTSWHAYCSLGLERHTFTLVAGADRQEALHAKLGEVGTRIDMEGVSHTALRTAARTLREAGLFSFLRSDVRQAKTIFLQRWKGGSRPKKSDWPSELAAAADILSELEALENDSVLRSAVGTHSTIRNAPLRNLAKAAEWLRAVATALPDETAISEQIRVALTSLNTSTLSRLAALAAPARHLISFLDQHAFDASARWSTLRNSAASRASALAALADGLRATGLSKDLLLSSFEDLIIVHKEWHSAREALASERAHTARAAAPDDLQVLRSSVGFAKNIIDRYGHLGSFYLEDGWGGRIATLRDHAASARSAAERTYVALNPLAELGLRRFVAEATGRSAQTLQADAASMVAAGSELPPFLAYALAREACLSNLLATAVLAAFEEGREQLHQLPEALEWLIAWTLVKRHADAKRAIFTRTGEQLSSFRQSFAENDRTRIASDAKLVQSAVLGRQVPHGLASGSKSTWTDNCLLQNEYSKQKRHIAVRDLLNRAGGAVTTLTPCLMMSPLTVAQYLKPGGLTFDLIVMDEASQIKPEDAIGAMLRGKQVVVVGDPKQLPPTNFFDRAIGEGDEEEEGAAREDGPRLSQEDRIVAESVLDLALRAFRPARRLRWHYRSQHESLIAFSNRAFYDNNLVVFPSAQAPSETLGIEMVRVNGSWQERINEAEAKAVAASAADFMRRHPDLSLGIVAMNQPQRDLIRAEIDAAVGSDSKLAEYMEKWEEALEEPFVKNLENVQGDERDVIFISLGWGRTPQGALHQRFYPVNRRDDGHRRLNVLFTRAKRKIVLFASLQAEDILLSETSAPGVRVLRDYLAYARDGRLERGNVGEEEADSPFETSVAGALRALGHDVALQVGVAGYRIDMAVRHPEEPDRFVLGIECDGATYHRAKSARDRDRLRQEALERLGWKLARVWSTDWFRDPVSQTERLSQEISAALAQQPSGTQNRRRLVEEAFAPASAEALSQTTQREAASQAAQATERVSQRASETAPLADGAGALDGTIRPTTLTEALVTLREEVIMRDFPGSEPGRCILRDPMIELIIKMDLDDPEDFHAKIPEFHRTRTDGRQVAYLVRICDLVAEFGVKA
ncbi:DUF4011 domain-containing protein [Belnapia sp. T18]|uniref:DUF4011 domain-containing protein n=1 Tax=Belnapia arida TaxID=2804533 RepID=A0ABS1UBQ0_9PROT|nr:DUF4011 domain-containing protein [Belnapia arida]MBL6081945.1 DUF4011 domain-containing protein [Belnapia arida]